VADGAVAVRGRNQLAGAYGWLPCGGDDVPDLPRAKAPFAILIAGMPPLW